MDKMLPRLALIVTASISVSGPAIAEWQLAGPLPSSFMTGPNAAVVLVAGTGGGGTTGGMGGGNTTGGNGLGDGRWLGWLRRHDEPGARRVWHRWRQPILE